MKTAISLPDKLFKLAEETANKLGISRSKLFSQALEDYIQINNPQDITDKLNQIYSKEESKIDSIILEMQSLSITQENW